MKHMWQRLILISVLVVVLLGGALFLLHKIFGSGLVTSDEFGKTSVQVVLTDEGFVPQNIRIKQGTTVRFTTTRSDEFWPASNPHPTHSLYPAFDPKEPIEPSDSWSFTFDRVGVWGYHDHIRAYYTGIIQVDP